MSSGTFAWLVGLTVWNMLLTWWSMVDGENIRELRRQKP